MICMDNVFSSTGDIASDDGGAGHSGDAGLDEDRIVVGSPENQRMHLASGRDAPACQG
jgi:hypothetical protein